MQLFLVLSGCRPRVNREEGIQNIAESTCWGPSRACDVFADHIPDPNTLEDISPDRCTEVGMVPKQEICYQHDRRTTSNPHKPLRTKYLGPRTLQQDNILSL